MSIRSEVKSLVGVAASTLSARRWRQNLFVPVDDAQPTAGANRMYCSETNVAAVTDGAQLHFIQRQVGTARPPAASRACWPENATCCLGSGLTLPCYDSLAELAPRRHANSIRLMNEHVRWWGSRLCGLQYRSRALIRSVMRQALHYAPSKRSFGLERDTGVCATCNEEVQVSHLLCA